RSATPPLVRHSKASSAISLGNSRQRWAKNATEVRCRLSYEKVRIASSSATKDEPPHIHVERDECYAKFWLDPISLARSRGFRSNDLNELHRIVERNAELFRRRWHEHLGR